MREPSMANVVKSNTAEFHQGRGFHASSTVNLPIRPRRGNETVPPELQNLYFSLPVAAPAFRTIDTQLGARHRWSFRSRKGDERDAGESSERNIVHGLFGVRRRLAAGLGSPRVAIARSLSGVSRIRFRGRELIPSHGFLLENLCRLLEMAHDQAEEM